MATKSKPKEKSKSFESTSMDVSDGEDEDFRPLFIRNLEGSIKSKETSPTSTSDGRRLESGDKPTTPRRDVLKASYRNSPRIFQSPTTPGQLESGKYENRSKAGDVVFRYNCKDSSHWENMIKSETSRNLKWDIINTNPFNRPLLKINSKYMFQRTREMSIVLNDVVSELGNSVVEYYSLDTPANLTECTAEDEVYIGRIRSEGKLSDGSILFEGTMESSLGHLVSLDMSGVEEYFIFPGQVLGLSGKNNLGRCVQVSQLFIPRPFPFRQARISINKTTGPLSILIAAGPFTPTDSLSFEPLKDLRDVIEKTDPDICFLIGPFLDATHPMLQSEDTVLLDTFQEIFENELQKLSNRLQDRRTKVILVSSWKDAHHHAVFPTLPYSIKKFSQIMAISDPGVVSIGGLIFGVTSTDILMHLSRNELAKTTINSDRMGRMARHLMAQRNFYPLYPPDESVPLDIEFWADHARMEVTPHILILPSELRHFIKDVDGTVVVNPERLTKGISGGTYARIYIDLPNDPDEENSIGNGSPIADFVMGEIIKI